MKEDKVDLLDVLDSAADEMNCQCGHPMCSKQKERARILKARAALAELLDRAEYLCRTGNGMIAFRSALAACTPAKEGRM